jgi:hypothetical protein
MRTDVDHPRSEQRRKKEMQQLTNILGWQFATIGFVWASLVACRACVECMPIHLVDLC